MPGEVIGGGGGKLFSFNEKRETPQLTQDLKYYLLYSFKDYPPNYLPDYPPNYLPDYPPNYLPDYPPN
jgi:hypothetical protein